MQWKTILDTTAAVAMIGASGAIAWRLFVPLDNTPPPTVTGAVPSEPISLLASSTARKGNPNASVVVIEYSDFQCPFCGAFAGQTLPALDREYVQSGKAQFVYRHFPLSIHPFARAASVAAECSRRQGRFWEMHDGLYRDAKDMSREAIGSLVREIGLDVPAYSSCADGDGAVAVESDIKSGQELDVKATPTLFIGRLVPNERVKLLRRLTGMVELGALRAHLDEALSTR